jgi:hypothetical protein
MQPQSKLIARTAMRVMKRLDSYKSLMRSIEMEHAMCSAYGVAFSLPIDTMYESCYNQTADIVAKHLKCSTGTVLWCIEDYLHQPQGPRK